MRLLLLLLLVLTAGCGAGSLESARMRGQMVPRGPGEVRDSRRCQELDQEHRTWSAWAAAFASGSGTTGLAQIPVEYLEPRYQGGVRIGLASGAVLFAAAAAYAVDRSSRSATTWARECAE